VHNRALVTPLHGGGCARPSIVPAGAKESFVGFWGGKRESGETPELPRSGEWERHHHRRLSGSRIGLAAIKHWASVWEAVT